MASHEVSKSRTETALRLLFAAAYPLRSLFNISNAAVASWSRSDCGFRAGLVSADPPLLGAYPVCGPKAGEVVVDVL